MADEADLLDLMRGDLDMARRDFRQAGLSGLNLSGRDFTGAHLTEADARGANFSGCIFTTADTRGLNAEKANFSGVHAESTVFYGVNFRFADLTRALVSRSHFSKTNFSQADLRGADFRNAVLNAGTTFEGALVDDATFFDGAQVFRPTARQPAFHNYTVERGVLVRVKSQEAQIRASPSGAELSNAVEAALSALKAVKPNDDGGVKPSELIGHNHPPPEAALQAEDYAALTETLLELRAQAADTEPEPEPLAIQRACEFIRGINRQIVRWASKRLAQIEDGFFTQLGKSLADPKSAVLAWLVVSGRLDDVISAVARFRN